MNLKLFFTEYFHNNFIAFRGENGPALCCFGECIYHLAAPRGFVFHESATVVQNLISNFTAVIYYKLSGG